MSMHKQTTNKIKPTNASKLKLNFYTIRSNYPLFYASFPDVLMLVFLLCLLCVNMENKFVPTLVRRSASPFYLYMDHIPT